MKFLTARIAAKEMAGDRYHSIGYTVTTFRGESVPRCEFYIDGYGARSAPTWEGVFESMRKAIDGTEVADVVEMGVGA